MVVVVHRHGEAVVIEGSSLVRVPGEDGKLDQRRHIWWRGGGVERVHGG